MNNCMTILLGITYYPIINTVFLDSTNEWFVNMDRGFFNIAVFFDLQKSFDTIDHGIWRRKVSL